MAISTTSFPKGKSGNSSGRPVGKTSRSHFRDLAESSIPSIVEMLIVAAQAGDIQASKIILDRLIPALKPTSDSVCIPNTGTLAQRGERIIAAMNKGICSPDQAKAALDVLQGQAKLIEQTEIAERLEAIELQLKGKFFS